MHSRHRQFTRRHIPSLFTQVNSAVNASGLSGCTSRSHFRQPIIHRLVDWRVFPSILGFSLFHRSLMVSRR